MGPGSNRIWSQWETNNFLHPISLGGYIMLQHVAVCCRECCSVLQGVLHAHPHTHAHTHLHTPHTSTLTYYSIMWVGKFLYSHTHMYTHTFFCLFTHTCTHTCTQIYTHMLIMRVSISLFRLNTRRECCRSILLMVSYVAVCCSLLHCVAVCCSVLQCRFLTHICISTATTHLSKEVCM